MSSRSSTTTSNAAGSNMGFLRVRCDTRYSKRLVAFSWPYRIAIGPQQGRKVFTLQTLPACEPEDQFAANVGQVPVSRSTPGWRRGG
ncbi:MAG: hypothetical protein GY792_15205 [Gammaproteobacteria bacterium]|nr:hypothetical protein [Gammaproteobacteria bacterium]